MKHTHKILAILLAAMLLLGFAACGDEKESPNKPAPDILGEWYYYDEDKHSDAYAPVLTFNADGTFHYYVNLLEDMGNVTGTYEIDGSKIKCAVASIDFEGFSGDDITAFEVSIGETTLTYNGGSFGDAGAGSVFERKKPDGNWDGSYGSDEYALVIENTNAGTFDFTILHATSIFARGTAALDPEDAGKASGDGFVFALDTDTLNIAIIGEDFSETFVRADGGDDLIEGGGDGRGDYLPENPADVNWRGEYRGNAGILYISNFDQNPEGIWHFRFELTSVDEEDDGVAAIDPDAYAVADCSSYQFTFSPGETEDSDLITITGGTVFDGEYPRFDPDAMG